VPAQTGNERRIKFTDAIEASFKIRLNGEPVAIATVGQAYRFITSLNTVEWMEFRSLHDNARVALEAAAENTILCAKATNALRALSPQLPSNT